MQTLIYDGSFAGWLTTVFVVYEYKYADVNIQPLSQRQDSLFGATQIIETHEQKAARVWKGLKEKLSSRARTAIYRTFFSGLPGMENKLLQYARYAFSSAIPMEGDLSNEAVLYVNDIEHKVHREKHRMEAFVRFQLTKDGLYFATVEPDYNVLPLILDHFEKRYADQRWMIYDLKRKYGIYYDLYQTTTVSVNFGIDTSGGRSIAGIVEESEVAYQQLWKHYFNSVNIKARKNMKLHIQHMPLRYWKYLIEKQAL